MANMTVTEFRGLAAKNGLPFPDQPYLRKQSRVTTSSSSAASAAIGTDCFLAEVSVDAATHIKVRASGDSTSATTDDTLFQPGVHHFDVKPGQTFAARTP